MKRLILVAIALLSLYAISHASPWDIDSLRSRLDTRDHIDPIEGIWQFPGDGARLFIEKSTATAYNIYLCDSPQLDLEPGLLIGTATATPKQNAYYAHLDCKKLRDKYLKKANVTISVTKDGTLSITPYSTGKRISLLRWIPYFYRVGIYDVDTRPKGLDGAMRIYPPSPAFMPVVL